MRNGLSLNRRVDTPWFCLNSRGRFFLCCRCRFTCLTFTFLLSKNLSQHHGGRESTRDRDCHGNHKLCHTVRPDTDHADNAAGPLRNRQNMHDGRVSGTHTAADQRPIEGIPQLQVNTKDGWLRNAKHGRNTGGRCHASHLGVIL